MQRMDAVTSALVVSGRWDRSHGVPAHRIHIMSSKIDAQRFRPVAGARSDYDLLLAAQLIARKRVGNVHLDPSGSWTFIARLTLDK